MELLCKEKFESVGELLHWYALNKPYESYLIAWDIVLNSLDKTVADIQNGKVTVGDYFEVAHHFKREGFIDEVYDIVNLM